MNEEKDNIINFLTGMENSGKVLFSEFYVSPNGEEQHDVVINKIETDKEGPSVMPPMASLRSGSIRRPLLSLRIMGIRMINGGGLLVLKDSCIFASKTIQL